MFATLLSFLGGSVFRMIWGEVSAWLTARQGHRFELQRMELQGKLDGDQHTRNQEAIRLQAELGVQTIRVQGEAQVGGIEAQAWATAVQGTVTSSGIWIVDLWNGVIRPLGATLCLGLVVLHFYRQNWALDEAGWQLIGAFLGIYVADRALYKRGK